MSSFLEVAYKVLVEMDEPLSVKQITDIGLANGWLETIGRTPWETMKARLSTDIRRNKEESIFMRTDEGQFGLRQWKNRYKEYVAQHFEKSILEEDVVVFPAASLAKYISGPGLHTKTLENSKDLLQECYAMPRELAEKNFSVIQLVSVFILKLNETYLTYKRTKRLPESRLHDYYSLTFGGHLNPEETIQLFDIFDPEVGEVLLLRELLEEVKFPRDSFPTISYKGLLYDNSRPLSTQHLGIVFDVFLKSDVHEIGERGFLMDSMFETLDQIKARLSDFENWSVMIVEHEDRRF